MVTLIRYQLKQSRPVERRASSVVGSMRFPFRVIEIRAAGVRREIISLDRFTGWLFVRASGFEIDFDDFRVAVTPLTFDQIDAFFCRQINYCVWFSSRRVGVRFGKARPARNSSVAQINSAVKRNRRIDASIGAQRWR